MKQNRNVYICEKEWKTLLRAISKISESSVEKILKKGRYPNNNTFPPLYGIDSYTYSKERIEYLCPRSNHEARRYVIPDQIAYDRFVINLRDCWNQHESKRFFPNSLSIKELIKSNKKVLPISSCILRKDLEDKQLTKIYHDSIDNWKRYTQRYLYEDSIHFEYLLEMDVKDFYSKVYVHSVTWALSGDRTKIKDLIKTNRAAFKKLKCSKLEESIMDLQDRQTNGIPVGSLGSDIVAEILMCRIVKTVEDTINLDYIGIRFKDDIKILCKSKEDAYLIMDAFITELNKYDLDLNGNKTKISSEFSKLPAKEWQKKIITLPNIDCDFSPKPNKGEIYQLDNDLMALLIYMSELISPDDGNFWFDFKRRYLKYFRYLVKKSSSSRGRIITWLLGKLEEYPQHTGIILNIAVSLISTNDEKYLKLIREKGKRLSMRRNFDFCMLWIIYFLGERYLAKKHAKNLHKVFAQLKLDINEITNTDIKRESIKLLNFIEKNRRSFTGRKPITKFFMKSFIMFDYE